jgi:hypothetical protein
VGDLIFSRVVTLEGLSLLFGMAPYVAPPEWHEDMLAWRDEHLRAPTVTREMVAAREFELRDLYLDVRDSVLNPAPPVVLNADGDPLCDVTLIYALSVNVATARERLLPLATLGAAVHEMHVERDAAGVVTSTELAWMSRTGKPSRIAAASAVSSAGASVLGGFMLGADRLAVTVNSEKRATAIARQIRARFGAEATLLERVGTDPVAEALSKTSR